MKASRRSPSISRRSLRPCRHGAVLGGLSRRLVVQRKGDAAAAVAAATTPERARLLGATAYATRASSVASSDARLQLACAAALFGAEHGLDPLSPEERELLRLRATSQGEDGVAGVDVSALGREERTLVLWVNALNIRLHGDTLIGAQGSLLRVNDLVAELRDGVFLIHIIDRVISDRHSAAGSSASAAARGAAKQRSRVRPVDWKKANLKPNSRFKELENASHAIELGEGLELHLVSIHRASKFSDPALTSNSKPHLRARTSIRVLSFKSGRSAFYSLWQGACTFRPAYLLSLLGLRCCCPPPPS